MFFYQLIDLLTHSQHILFAARIVRHAHLRVRGKFIEFLHDLFPRHLRFQQLQCTLVLKSFRKHLMTD